MDQAEAMQQENPRASRDVTEVERVVTAQQKAVSGLEEVLGQLLARLAPVVRAADPSPELAQVSEGYQTEHALELDGVATRVVDAQDRIASVLSRLEL